MIGVVEPEVKEQPAAADMPLPVAGTIELSARDSALTCGLKGLSVFGLCGGVEHERGCRNPHHSPKMIGKHPRWGGISEATTIHDRIKQMFERDPTINFGISTGVEVGNTGKVLVVIDVDSYKDGADDHLDAVQAKFGKLPDTVEVQTGGGGRHFYFLAPLGVKFKQKMGHDGIDIKGLGGYVVGPGSIHRTGKAYVFEASGDLFDGHQIADLPNWVIDQFGKVEKEPDASAGPMVTSDLAQAQLKPYEIISIQSDLAVLSAACGRDEWLKILMALHSRSSGLKMFEIADQWSQNCPEKYVASAVIDAWNSFNSDGGITYAHVRLAARHEIAKTVDISKLLESINRMPVTAVEQIGQVEADTDVESAEVDAPAMPKPSRLKLVTTRELTSAPPMEWIIRGLLPRTGIAALYGPSGAGKSFLALDMAMAIAGAVDEWYGMRVNNCPVIYCVLEGEGGMSKRAQAWEKHHTQVAPDSLRFMPQSINIMQHDDVIELARVIVDGGLGDGVIILDTLNRAAPLADENASKDMGAIIAGAKRLQELTNGLVMLVHHTGKSTDAGLRGHSSLFAAMDCVISVGTDKEKGPVWSVTKSKDDVTGKGHPFSLQQVVVDTDDEGEDITSCVAVSGSAPFALSGTRKPGKHQNVALQVMKSMFADCKVEPKKLPFMQVLATVADALETSANHKREYAKKALMTLAQSKHISIVEDHIMPYSGQ